MNLMAWKSLVLLFCLTVARVGATRSSTGRIIGGEEASIGDFPSAAAIFVETSDSTFFCGGTLYNHVWIITSAHCVYNAVRLTVQVGSHILEGEDSNREIQSTSEYVVHPDFNPETIENDIALVRVPTSFTYTLYVQPSFLPEKEIEADALVTSVGWGQISESNSERPNVLRYVDTVTLSNIECQTIYGNQIVDNMVCAVGNYNEGTCIGDNGGPLLEYYMLHFHYIVGVSSFVSGNGCESTDPSGYTRVFPYVQWIRNVTRTGGCC